MKVLGALCCMFGACAWLLLVGVAGGIQVDAMPPGSIATRATAAGILFVVSGACAMLARLLRRH